MATKNIMGDERNERIRRRNIIRAFGVLPRRLPLQRRIKTEDEQRRARELYKAFGINQGNER